jgi:hypothetical protein
METEDADYSVTACGKHMKRGNTPNQMEIIKLFTPTYIPPSNFMVYPFGICKEEVCFVLDPTEVSSIELLLSFS